MTIGFVMEVSKKKRETMGDVSRTEQDSETAYVCVWVHVGSHVLRSQSDQHQLSGLCLGLPSTLHSL